MPPTKTPNPASRLDDSFLRLIDTEGKAYLLGWIAGECRIQPSKISIVAPRRDQCALEQLRFMIGAPKPIVHSSQSHAQLSIHSMYVVDDACRHLGIQPSATNQQPALPPLPNDGLAWSFVRGLFDCSGSVNNPPGLEAPHVRLINSSARIRQAIIDLCPHPCVHDPGRESLAWHGNSALDFLGLLYDGSTYRLERKYDRYLDWCMWIPSFNEGSGRRSRPTQFQWSKVDPRAAAPVKQRASDSGYDLTLIDVVKRTGIVTMYTTGIKIQPDYGWYFDLVPRSSISKTGHALANSVGIIDRTYTGPILVPLIKVDPAAAELELPARIIQIVPRPIMHLQAVEVDQLQPTARGEGGFGSTDGRTRRGSEFDF